MIIRELSAAQCTAIVAANRLARLACSSDNQPYAVPIFYAYADDCAYAFTMPGRKLDTMRANPNVAILVEEKGEGRTWQSVVAEGLFEELPDQIGHKRLRERAWSLLSKHVDWWEPGALKPALPPAADHAPHVFFRIHITRMSGRDALEA
ncbi:pyridoxamine 5'-phosphate oxidase family protein [Martelella soudanensis]|uniref:pyridoxamine 5'-phosphate oxidase family protein n=1 Tax=unclassified Martelella TaxID=2629616 RepID=UPI0015DE3767|nr:MULTISPECIES: pyridoxamine 5'-phosphate oxidase family protein [unclassified Martelella]